MRKLIPSLKSALERLFALLLIIIFSPYLIMIYLAIDQFGGKPVFVTDELLASDGTIAKCLRFRTTGHGRPEFRALGRFLRQTKMDELPAIWSVLCGDIPLREVSSRLRAHR